jgi:hypothetical protein
MTNHHDTGPTHFLPSFFFFFFSVSLSPFLFESKFKSQREENISNLLLCHNNTTHTHFFCSTQIMSLNPDSTITPPFKTPSPPPKLNTAAGRLARRKETPICPGPETASTPTTTIITTNTPTSRTTAQGKKRNDLKFNKYAEVYDQLIPFYLNRSSSSKKAKAQPMKKGGKKGKKKKTVPASCPSPRVPKIKAILVTNCTKE